MQIHYYYYYYYYYYYHYHYYYYYPSWLPPPKEPHNKLQYINTKKITTKNMMCNAAHGFGASSQ